MVRLTLGFLISLVAATGSAWAADAAMRFVGKGDQIYVCNNSSGGYSWTLKAPDAILTGPKQIGSIKHFAGPTWQAKDGSSVVGEAVATSSSPTKGAIPWLVLRAKSHSGSGVMANVAYVVRAETRGGVAPSTGCDQAHANAEKRVPYTATYMFFPVPAQR